MLFSQTRNVSIKISDGILRILIEKRLQNVLFLTVHKALGKHLVQTVLVSGLVSR